MHRKNKYGLVLNLLLLATTLFMGIGYASVFSVSLDIDGELVAKTPDGVFITEVKVNGNVNADLANTKVLGTAQTTLNSIVTLSPTDSDSSLTYEITVHNRTDDIYTFTGVTYDSSFYSNNNVTFELINLKEGDSINPSAYLTFKLKFYYKGTDTSNNVLDSYLNFEFSNNTWSSITSYGTSSFKVLNSKDGSFATINYTNVGGNFEKLNLPLRNLEVGGLYQLTFTTWNNSGIITTNADKLMFGCTVMSSPATNYSSSSQIIGNAGYNSGYLWKSLSVDEQTTTLTFKATASTMYWVWDLSILNDRNTNLYIKDVSIEKSVKPSGAYIDVPNTTVHQVEYLGSSSTATATLTISKGTYITKASYDDLVIKMQTAGGFEFINIPIVGLTSGKSYTVSFSNYTSSASKSSWKYGAKVQAKKQESGSQLVTDSDYLITDLSIVNNGSITFTATSSTMYLVWDCGGLSDNKWSDIRIYNLTLK